MRGAVVQLDERDLMLWAAVTSGMLVCVAAVGSAWAAGEVETTPFDWWVKLVAQVGFPISLVFAALWFVTTRVWPAYLAAQARYEARLDRVLDQREQSEVRHAEQMQRLNDSMVRSFEEVGETLKSIHAEVTRHD